MPYFPQNEQEVSGNRSAVMEALMTAGNTALKHPLPKAVGKVLHLDSELAQKIWGYTPEEIGDDVLERTGSPAAATAMHLGRELATPLNTAFSIYGPTRQGIKGLMGELSSPRTVRPPVPEPTPAPPSVAPEGGVSRRDLFKKAGGAAAAVVLARPIIKALEHLAPVEKRATGQVIDELAPKIEPTPGVKTAEIPKVFDLPAPKHIIEYGKGEGPMIPDEFGSPRPLATHVERYLGEGESNSDFNSNIVRLLNEHGPSTREELIDNIIRDAIRGESGKVTRIKAGRMVDDFIKENNKFALDLTKRHHKFSGESATDASPIIQEKYKGKYQINPKHLDYIAARDLRHTHEAENTWHYAERLTTKDIENLSPSELIKLGDQIGIRHEKDLGVLGRKIEDSLSKEVWTIDIGGRYQK